MSSSTHWRKSSFSGIGEDNHCVEVAVMDSKVWLRESDIPATAITTTPGQLATFIRTVKTGALDHLS
ncbi:DUF397 domain-containing protein [Streptomyces lonegramiae]|uniref:DUF397 domain-containing protein n=2 Tax=Streptomyces TaxID=1883 RepID=A0ABU2XCB3_9ACTN|nr:DUF397 domain-containing protein [Streptomyces sp. DSM 41529]MDT0543195.1 DUF397 domain-containing protein [Streptomyces sp. DSM 41529]